jgi:hypothetical protein
MGTGDAAMSGMEPAAQGRWRRAMAALAEAGDVFAWFGEEELRADVEAVWDKAQAWRREHYPSASDPLVPPEMPRKVDP